MYYILYKTTNLINGKIYVGVHKTNNLDDGYLGSGKYLGYAIEKYGKENFKREILAYFEKASDMFDAESELVNEEFVSRDDTYNLTLGGKGGWDFLIKNPETGVKELMNTNDYQKILRKTNPEKYEHSYQISSENTKRLHSDGILPGWPDWTGKKHTEESKQKIGKANSIKQSGEKNSQYGTIWIHNLILKKSKRINKNESIPDGWLKGRKMKFD